MVIPVRAGWRTAASSEPSQTLTSPCPLPICSRFLPQTPPPPHPFSKSLCLSPSLGEVKLPDMRLQHPAP